MHLKTNLDNLSENQLDNIRYFENPEPVREISLLVHRNVIKKRLLIALQEEILKVIPVKMQHKEKINSLKIK